MASCFYCIQISMPEAVQIIIILICWWVCATNLLVQFSGKFLNGKWRQQQRKSSQNVVNKPFPGGSKSTLKQSWMSSLRVGNQSLLASISKWGCYELANGLLGLTKVSVQLTNIYIFLISSCDQCITKQFQLLLGHYLLRFSVSWFNSWKCSAGWIATEIDVSL